MAFESLFWLNTTRQRRSKWEIQNKVYGRTLWNTYQRSSVDFSMSLVYNFLSSQSFLMQLGWHSRTWCSNQTGAIENTGLLPGKRDVIRSDAVKLTVGVGVWKNWQSRNSKPQPTTEHFICFNFLYNFLLWYLTLSLPRVINFNFLCQSLTRDITYSMENLAFDSLLRWKLIEQSFLTTSLNHFLLEW